MSAREDYARAKKLVETPQTADSLRELITSIRLEERTTWSGMAKTWAEQLDALDEDYLATWLRMFADNIRNGIAELPDMGPPEPEPLLPLDEDDL